MLNTLPPVNKETLELFDNVAASPNVIVEFALPNGPALLTATAAPLIRVPPLIVVAPEYVLG